MRTELINARKIRKKTQQNIADSVGIDRTTYTRIERGELEPKIGLAYEIAKCLKKKVTDIFPPTDVYDIHRNPKKNVS